MPLEIKEMVIKINVNENASSPGGPATGGAAPPMTDKNAIISECLEQINELLKRKNER